MSTYDAIVIGTGGVGSAALFHLAERGLRVIGLDRFPAAHDRGSSHGHTRLIRQAYFEHPDYVPLLLRAYELWHDLEERAGRRLFEASGLLQAGPADGVVCPGVLRSAQMHDLAVESLGIDDARRRWPMFHFHDQMQVVYEPAAGMLYVEDCVAAHLDEAQAAGAERMSGVSVLDWHSEDRQIVVETDQGRFEAGHLILTAGAWSPALLRRLRIPFQVVRKHLHWFATHDARYELGHPCPGYFFEIPQGYYYGMPKCDERGVKAAEHSGGDLVDDPLSVDRTIDSAERSRVEGFVREFLPGVGGPAGDHTVCMYTKTPDEHFVVDRLADSPRVVFAAGLSGHGFKFTTVLGEILCQLVVDGETSHPIEFLRADRF